MATNTTPASLVAEEMAKAERHMNWTAERSGMSLSSFRRRYYGGQDFTVNELGRIALALGVEPWKLLPAEFRQESAAA